MSETKQAISRTARQIFLNEGHDGVSMRKIADAVGVSATAIYRHYTGKNELLDEIAEDGFGILAEYLQAELDGIEGAERLDAVCLGYLRFALEQPEHYEFMFVLPRTNVRRYSDGLARGRSETFNVLVTEVAGAIARGRLSGSDAPELALTIWALLHGLITFHRAGRFAGDDDEFEELYRRSVARLLTGIEA